MLAVAGCSRQRGSATFEGQQWVLGDTLTLADLALSAPLTVTEPAKLALSSYPNMQSWLGRMQNLDAWKKTTARSTAR
jgi:glutathione S-transferase